MGDDSEPNLTAPPAIWDDSPAENIPARVRRAEHELDFLRKLHVQAIVNSDRSQGLPELMLHQIASCLRLVETQFKLWSWLQKEDSAPLAASTPLAELWKILTEIPELGQVLSRREVQEKIIAKIKGNEK